ncbi:DUF1190 domain-containing protein [Aureimonas glaciei]|uniref:DUF1190 domain-containing protein n=1 Tax=Aureimonas glaciei TaxID=1776957 RepID=A0A916YCQ0_9HYPH|nr:DUF1190 domain-containing protein [Aureimonas glaciei]GGD40357.1 hypothetical protein GCM10011335_48810 [Aureimonas glaciei]
MTRRFTGRRPPILVLGTIAVSGLALSSCGETPPAEIVYNSAAQCIEAGVDSDICNAEYQQALQQHVQNAPKFNAMAVCEAEYGEGRCMEAAAQGSTGTGTGGFFVPFMTGYLVSSAISNLTNYGAYRNYRRDTGYNSAPIYTGRGGQTYRSDPPAIGQPPQPRPYNVNTRTVSRQGFGGLSSNRGFSFGG